MYSDGSPLRFGFDEDDALLVRLLTLPDLAARLGATAFGGVAARVGVGVDARTGTGVDTLGTVLEEEEARIREGFTDASILTADEEAPLEEAAELALDADRPLETADEARFTVFFFPLLDFGLALGLADFLEEEALFEEATLVLLTLALLFTTVAFGLGDEALFTTALVVVAGIFLFFFLSSFFRVSFFLFLYICVS